MDEEMNRCLTQLGKIAQLTNIVSQLAMLSIEAPLNPVPKLFKDENLPSNEDEQATFTQNPPLHHFKVEAWIEIPIYDGSVDVERLDQGLLSHAKLADLGCTKPNHPITSMVHPFNSKYILFINFE